MLAYDPAYASFQPLLPTKGAQGSAARNGRAAEAGASFCEGKIPDRPPGDFLSLRPHQRRDCGYAQRQGGQADPALLEHDPEKWKPFFRKDHAHNKYLSARNKHIAGATAMLEKKQ